MKPGGMGSQKLMSLYTRTTATASADGTPKLTKRAIMTLSITPSPPGVGPHVHGMDVYSDNSSPDSLAQVLTPVVRTGYSSTTDISDVEPGAVQDKRRGKPHEDETCSASVDSRPQATGL